MLTLVGSFTSGDSLVGSAEGRHRARRDAGSGSLAPREWMHRMGREANEIIQDPIVVALGRVPLFSALSLEDLATLATVLIGVILIVRDEAADVLLDDDGGRGWRRSKITQQEPRKVTRSPMHHSMVDGRLTSPSLCL